ncbi:MAG TPA: DUF87 domain-containing protein [Candidatus Collinsella stercoripullorum]|nr:DUF87 domain-containing protein [Candidatus Collinsella stercoripullorum]
MGIKSVVKKAAGKAGDAVSKLSSLSPEQLREIERERAEYLSAMPSPDDPTAIELTSRLVAAAGVEIFDAYLPQIDRLYLPVESAAEYDSPFDDARNIRFINITKWVTDADENSLEKLVNVYDVLSNEQCNIALVFHRTMKETKVFLAVVNTLNADNNVDVDSFARRIEAALRGNFPGSEWSGGVFSGRIPCLRNMRDMSVAAVSNIPTEKSERFASQTIEKLLDGVVPRNRSEEYCLVLLATPASDLEERKARLEQLYTGLAPYASWQTSFTYQESKASGSSATVGVNAGLSIGRQAGSNQSLSSGDTISASESQALTQSENESLQQSTSASETDSTSRSEGTSESTSDTDTVGFGLSAGKSIGGSLGASVGANGTGAEASVNGSLYGSMSANYSHSHGRVRGVNTTDTVGRSLTKGVTDSIGRSTGQAVSNTLGRAVTRSLTNTVGAFASTSLGGNFGVNFARSSTFTATIGKNEGINQTHVNYSIKHALEILDKQMARLEQGVALGLWDFAAYVVSEDSVTADNVAHTYLALTQGEDSFMTKASVNVWRGDIDEDSSAATICDYLRDLRHPIFALHPDIVERQPNVLPYPAIVSATATLTGKELARSLNFPKRSVAGLPVFGCASFGRNVSISDERPRDMSIKLGSIYHMHREEPSDVRLDRDSLTSHVFVTGSTGAGKSNAVYRLLEEASREEVGFLIVEPAKGEYKDVFGTDGDVHVFGTNPAYAPLLRLNPFSFPEGIHVLEHVDRLVELFNVCWPMYAAMPAVLKSAVERSYEDCGWNLVSSDNPYGSGLYPCFADVARNVREIIDSSEYDAENKGAYKGSLLTRLTSLTTGINGMVFSSEEIPQEELFDGKTVVDLSRVGSGETKSLLMGIIVLKLQERRMTQDIPHNSCLRHLTVLEEAHNLLRRASADQSAEGGNLLGKSVEMLANSIAEMRTYGEGFIIADQAPGLLDASVIRNANTKIVLRLPEGGDRSLVGGSEALTDSQIAELARLPRGVAAVYQNDWIEAVLCKIDKAEHGEGRYIYQPESMADSEQDAGDALAIAALLSSCERVSGEDRLHDLRLRMKAVRLDASLQVAVMRLVAIPPEKPKMTKLAPIIGALFPEVRDAALRAIERGGEAVEWTAAARNELRGQFAQDVPSQVERDVIQAIFVQILYVENKDIAALERWTKEGRLW